MAEALVHAEEIGKTYGTVVKTVALHDVSFEIEAGEFASVIGESGSGKSTLLNLIGALDTPSSGSLTIAGTPVRGCAVHSAPRCYRQRGTCVRGNSQVSHLVAGVGCLISRKHNFRTC